MKIFALVCWTFLLVSSPCSWAGSLTLTQPAGSVKDDEAVKAILARWTAGEAQPFRGARFEGYYGDQFRRLLMDDFLGSKDPAPSIDFGGATFLRCEIVGLKLGVCNFTNASFVEWVRFDHCYMPQCGFDGSLSTCGKAMFEYCNLSHAYLGRCRVKAINFHACTLSDCDFQDSRFERITFENACSLLSANLAHSSWKKTIFDIKPKELPYIPSLAAFEGLENFDYALSPASLSELRKSFQEADLREQERQITSALQTRQTREAPLPERLFKTIFFGWTSSYGLHSGRPLLLLGWLWLICAVPYAIAMLQTPSFSTSTSGTSQPDMQQGGIWAVPLEKRLDSSASSDPVRLHVQIPGGTVKLIRLSLFFSAISAFSTGYKDLDVGRWIERINPNETTLRGTRWVRSISGIQSLLSFYLLALWLLVYFGRPFD